MTDAPLVLAEPGPIWRITLNRPGARNAVSTRMLTGLVEELGRAAADSECRVVLVDGAGPDFCAGADVAELLAARRDGTPADYGRAFEAALGAMEQQPQPVVAVVHGAALGAGCQIAVAADLALAAEEARIGIPSAKLGVVVTYENVERLTLAVGPKRAGEFLLAGRILSGVEAARWGLVNTAVPSGELAASSRELAEGIARLAPLSVRGSKRGIRTVLEGLRAGASVAAGGRAARVEEFDRLAAAAFLSEDLAEGIAAFRERRVPVFRGR